MSLFCLISEILLIISQNLRDVAMLIWGTIRQSEG